MKLLLFALLFSSVAAAQTTIAGLDTIVVSSLTLKSRDWAYFTGSTQLNNRDSAYYSELRKIRTQILAANPTGWNQDITLTNLTGGTVLRMYEQIRNVSAGEAEQLHSSTLTNLRAVTKLKPWYDEVDARFPNEYTYKRNQGKYLILDQ